VLGCERAVSNGPGRLLRAADDHPRRAVAGGSDGRGGAGLVPGREPDPLYARTAEAFATHVAAGTVPSIRAIRATLHVGQPRAQQVRAHLATAARQAHCEFMTDCPTGDHA